MATRVTLFHNPQAGKGQHSKEELLETLQQKGFETTYVSTKNYDYPEVFKQPVDLVIVAGGDGTVGKVARQLIKRNIPLGVLPLGTANNIASSLGIKGNISDIITGWSMSKRKHFDVGLVNGPNGEIFFLESAGFGIFSKLIRKHEKEEDNNKQKDNHNNALKKALKDEQDLLDRSKSFSCIIQIEGEKLAGNFLLVEIMNIRLAGPNMDLAPEADPGDGLLDVVMVREDEREKFWVYLQDCLTEKNSPVNWQVRRAKELQVEWSSKYYHTDDEVHEAPSPISISISLIPKGLEFLVL